MKKVIHTVKSKIKLDKNLIIFLLVLLLVGLISGSIFSTILNSSDELLVNEHLNTFLTNIENNTLDYFNAFKSNFITNILQVILIWLLGISVIGLPIIIFIYFSKTFILGFTIGCILNTFKLRGILFATIYIFPFEVINVIITAILVMYSISFSIKMIYSVFKKKTVDFKFMINKYLIILFICLFSNLINSIYSSYVIPNILKNLISFIR